MQNPSLGQETDPAEIDILISVAHGVLDARALEPELQAESVPASARTAHTAKTRLLPSDPTAGPSFCE